MRAREVRKRLTGWLLGGALALVAATSQAQIASSPELLAFLKNEKAIRVWISSAPGFGHQAATVTVMRRLRQLGYSGSFEIVYAGSIAHKLETLLPGFRSDVSAWQDVPGENVRAISYADFSKQSELPTVSLGLTGADDDLEFMRPERLRVQSYLRLQPQGWGESHLISAEKPQALAIPGLAQLGFTYDIPDSADHLRKALEQMKLVPELTGKVAGLETILNHGMNSNEAASVEIGAIYGVGLIADVSGRLRFWLEAIQAAQRSSPTSFRGGVVLPVLSGMNEVEMRALAWELKHLSDSAPRGSGGVRLIGIVDPALPSEISNLKSGDILLIPTGKVTQDVFEILFKRSRLPILVAGKNASNLAQLLGKPHLNTVGDYGGHGVGASPDTKKTLSEAAAAFHYSLQGPQHRRKVSKFILSSLDPESHVSEYFRSLAPSGRDKVAEALEFAIRQGVSPKSTLPGICIDAF
jgi:hypothetical protein